MVMGAGATDWLKGATQTVRESGRRHRRNQDTARKSDTQTLSMFLRHAVAIYLLQCRIIYYYKTKDLAKAYIIRS